MCACMCKLCDSHTPTHTRTHTRTHTGTRRRSSVSHVNATCPSSYRCKHTHTHTHTHTRARTHTHIHRNNARHLTFDCGLSDARRRIAGTPFCFCFCFSHSLQEPEQTPNQQSTTKHQLRDCERPGGGGVRVSQETVS